MTFSALVGSEIKNYNVEYKWTVDIGTIISGQGTTTIQVSTEGLSDSVINAVFEINGLSKNCNNKDSDAGIVGQRIEIDPSDRYQKISWADELSRIDSFLISIQKNPEYKGYIRISTSKNESIINVKKHIQKLVKHIKFRKISPSRTVFIIEKSEHHQTTLIFIPEGAKIPKCENCEIIRGSEMQ